MAMNETQLAAFGVNAACDRCSANPLVAYRNEVLELDFIFCGHHANELAPSLKAKGFTVTVDLRDDAGRSMERGAEDEQVRTS